jgi:branched-chain amino acid transport system permease protein
MEFLISVSVLGTTYALLAAGIVIVYKASRVVNFAHGELAIVGAYGFYSAGLLSVGPAVSGMSLLVPIAVTAAISILFGVAIYLALMRQLLGQPTFVAAMVTIGVAIILKAAIVVIWSSRSVGLNIGRQTLMTFTQGGRRRA